MTGVVSAPSAISDLADALLELEFDKALELVARRAVGPLGADAIRKRRPGTEKAAIQAELEMVAELAGALSSGDGFEPVSVPDIAASVRTLRATGGVLEGSALAELLRSFQAMRVVHDGLRRVRDAAPRAASLVVELPPKDLTDQFARALEPDGTVKDDASPELRRARRDVRELRTRLVGVLRKIARDADTGDADVTVRGGRYVIPVRRDDRTRIQGLVHDESSSGATLFVEPVAAVELGNELRSAEAAEARAMHAVLLALTEGARDAVDSIELGWTMCIQADDLYARARYMIDCRSSMPTLVDAPAVPSLRRAYHPLILDESATPVPFDLILAASHRTLLVSGPNAGGKTVLLKAIALISGMAQAGIVPPIGPESVLPVFRRFFADIGDHQSIEDNLSTFSARVASLRHILVEADERSLVLLDEIGAGTDPFEGAALAGAVLLSLTSRGALTIATTHLSQLKDLAAANPGFLNGSLEFDADTLAPTYRLQLGQPGRSYGLAIARRLGLPGDVLAKADELIPESAKSLEAALADVETAAADLRERTAQLERDEARVAAAQAQVATQESDVAQRLDEVRRRERELEREGREQARQFLLEARKRVEEALSVARAAVDEATAKEARRLVEQGVAAEADALKTLADKGWTVKGQPGQSVEEPEPTGRTPVKSRTVAAETATSEIDLRGMTAAEAEALIPTAIDQAVMADLPWLRIIHGKGGGVLRKTVAEVLRRDRRVVRFRLALPHQGGAGVTIAEFTG